MVTALPATVGTRQFPVAWSGSDDASGVAGFDLYVQQDGGDWTPWLTGTTATGATFSGEDGHRYAFHALATDRVGNREG